MTINKIINMNNYVKNFFGHLKTVIVHKYWVFYYGCKLGIPVRAFFHDFSKFNPIEFFESVKYYQGGVSSPINAAKADKGYSLAWQHHKGHNPHHYEHWTDKYDTGTVPIKIPWKYVLEMLADYLGAGHAYQGKNFTLIGELKWWKNKLETNPLIHQETRNFMTQMFCSFANDNKVTNINNKFLKFFYENGYFDDARVNDKEYSIRFRNIKCVIITYHNIDDILKKRDS